MKVVKAVSVGDLVWVQTGKEHEEPGIVLQVGCERNDLEESSDQDEDEDGDNDVKTLNDGIFVKLNVSHFRGTYAPQEVRAFHVEGATATGSGTGSNNGQRRSRRLVRTIVTPLPSSEVQVDNKDSNGKSNHHQSDDNGGGGEEEEEDKKPAAKRKLGSLEAKSESSPEPTRARARAKEEDVNEDSDYSADKQAQVSSPYFEKAAAASDEEIPFPQVADKPKSKAKTKAKPALKTAATSKTKAAAKKPTKQAKASKKPKAARAAAAVPLGNENESDGDSDSDGVVERTKAKAKLAVKVAAKKPSKRAKASKPSVEVPAGNGNESDGNSDDDAETAKAKAKVKPAPTAKTKAVAKKPTKQAKPSVARAVAEVPAENENENGNRSDGDDSDDENERPFQVEYSPSGRATCRRCDQVITKEALRVSHVPLFRGKPGFRIYRHLHCALFTEDIKQARDVGGWRKLKKEDYEALALRVEESKLEMIKENEEIQPDELVQAAFQGEIRKSPPGLTANLLPFQVEGASWMYCQEVNVPENRGGTLADEMGMGKTIQTIATILDNRPKLQHSRPGAKHPPSSPDLEALVKEEALWKKSLEEWNIEMEMNNVPKKILPKNRGGARAGTLVVCPVIALSQWKSEIEKFTETDTLTVGIYHGPNRAKEMPAEMMQKYDIVLTTYQVMEQDFRKMVSPNKVSCPNCGAKYKVDKLPVHLKYFCGDGAQRTEAQSRQRRRTDRGGGRPGPGGGRPSGGGGKGKKKPPMTKEEQKKAASPKRKAVRVKSTAEYDSDSELSVNTDVVDTPARGRPSRKAAVSASKLMASSVNDWGAAIPVPGRTDVEKGEESSFSSASDDDDDDSVGSQSDDGSSLEEIILSDMVEMKGKGTSSTKKRNAASGKKRAVSEISSTDNDALNRAREKQRLALAKAKASKKNGKPAEKKSKGKKMAQGKKGKDKKYDSSSDDSSSDEPVDPMADIDMDKLVKEAMEGSRSSVLHSFCWWRIVLDEAHFIKSRTSQTAHSAFALSGIHRWCLSGTPLQNRVGELYSLIRFMRLDPMAHYVCRAKGCKCKSIHYRMVSGKCLHCGHSSISHYSHFNKYVLNPIQRDGYTGDGRRAMFILKNEVLDKCLLRRTKDSCAEDMNLPPRIVTIRTIRLHPIEEDFYNALYTQTRSSFDDYVAEGTLLNNYAHIFDLLTKMRQAVDHPYLIVYSQKNIDKRREQVANGSVECDICHEPPTDRVLSSCCGAGVCRSCVIDYLTGAGGENTPCPSCQAPFSIDLNQASVEDTVDDGTLMIAPADKSNGTGSSAMPSLKELTHVATGSILRRINLAEYATSSKIEVLVQELIEMRQKRPGSKALVFSQFVNMLDLIRWRLHSDPCLAKMGLGVRILHGGMNVKSRDETLKDFREDNSVRVLLMSLKSGGVALNLTVASEVFLMDNWWNPAAEMQAIDRTHRLGQYRPVRAVRFIAEGTVEERVLELQEKKRLVFDGTVGRDAGSLKALNVDDMKSLFA